MASRKRRAAALRGWETRKKNAKILEQEEKKRTARAKKAAKARWEKKKEEKRKAEERSERARNAANARWKNNKKPKKKSKKPKKKKKEPVILELPPKKKKRRKKRAKKTLEQWQSFIYDNTRTKKGKYEYMSVLVKWAFDMGMSIGVAYQQIAEATGLTPGEVYSYMMGSPKNEAA